MRRFMPLSRGARIGPHEVLDLIGVGAKGKVYRARDSKLNRDVALGHMMSVPITMSADRKTLTPGTPVDLFPVRLATGEFITTASLITRGQYDVAKDGRFLVNVEVEGYTPPPISIVLNWDALLKK
jgi:hypothetical protein